MELKLEVFGPNQVVGTLPWLKIIFDLIPDLNSMLIGNKSSPEWGDRRNLVFDSSPQQNLTPGDYEQKKFMAVKALQNIPNSTEARVPTSTWSGYGFSLTSPSTLFAEQKDYLNSHNVSRGIKIWV